MKVNWAKGLNDSGRPMVNPEAYYDREPLAVYPTGGGAHNWAPMSFSPNTGLAYIPASYTSYTYQADDEYKKGTNGDVRTGAVPRQIKAPAIGPTAPDGVRGGLQAWDPAKQSLVWRADGGGGIGGGSVTTGGNLVFHKSNDGRFVAYSADKVEKLYEVQTGRLAWRRRLLTKSTASSMWHSWAARVITQEPVPLMPRSITLPCFRVCTRREGRASHACSSAPPVGQALSLANR